MFRRLRMGDEGPVLEVPVMSFQILHRYTSAVLFSSDTAATILEAVKQANLSGANLREANLRGANLSGVDLSGVDLTGANLRGVDLRGADLRWVNLSGVDLSGAKLTGANLRGVDLRGVNLRGVNLRGVDLSGVDLSGVVLTGVDLRGVNLRGVNLSGANLRWVDLTGADLSGANLRGAKEDFFAVLAVVPDEVQYLRTALLEGRVNGSAYQGECACLVGTIANARHCAYDQIPELPPNSPRPAERFFLGIAKGHTPENSPLCKIAVEWIDEFIAKQEVPA